MVNNIVWGVIAKKHRNASRRIKKTRLRPRIRKSKFKHYNKKSRSKWI